MVRTADPQMPADVAAMSECLHSAFLADPGAMQALIANRVPCRASLADHPNVVVDLLPVLDGQHFAVGALGLINGMLTSAGYCWRAAAVFSDDADEEGRRKLIDVRLVYWEGTQ